MGFTFQIFSQYSRIDRSDENLPILATFSIAILFQVPVSFQVFPTRSWQAVYKG